MKRSAVLLLGLLLCVATAGRAGVVVDIEHHEGSGEHVEISTGRLFLDTGLLKMVPDTTNEAEPEFIYQGAKKRMLIVDHDHESYMSIDAETMKQISEQMQGVQAQMQEALSQLPPEQRKAAEEMMKQRMPPGMAQAREGLAVEVVALQGTETKEGKTCRGYEVRVGGKLQSRIWATEWKGVDIGKEDFQPFADMAAFFQELMKALPMMAQGESPDLFSGLDEIQGFPVVVESFDNGELSGETFFRNARRQKLDDSTFQPPKGYRETSMQDAMQGD